MYVYICDVGEVYTVCVNEYESESLYDVSMYEHTFVKMELGSRVSVLFLLCLCM